MNAPLTNSQQDDRDRAERDWLAQLRTGDERAFEQVFRRFVSPLCSFAYTYVHSRDESEEIVQNLFCWIWEQRFTLEMPRGMRPYLFSAVRNRSLNALRNSRVELALHDRLSRESDRNALAKTPKGTDANLLANDLSAKLAVVVAAMPTRCREVFTLLRDQQLSHAEVSEILGISTKTVEIHMTRALRTLRIELGPWIEP